MAAFRRTSLYVPTLVQCRHRGKPNIERPKPGPLERRVFEAITQPIIPDQLEDPSKLCGRITRLNQGKEEENLYEQFVLRRCREMFEENLMIVAFQPLALSHSRIVAIRNKFFHSGIHCKYFSNQIMRQTIKDTKWQNMEPLLVGKNFYAVSQDLRISQLVKDLKKMPDVLMLGGFLEDSLLTKDSLIKAAQLPPIDVLRGQTVAVLNSAASRTRSLLSSHTQVLSANLSQYVADQTPEGANS